MPPCRPTATGTSAPTIRWSRFIPMLLAKPYLGANLIRKARTIRHRSGSYAAHHMQPMCYWGTECESFQPVASPGELPVLALPSTTTRFQWQDCCETHVDAVQTGNGGVQPSLGLCPAGSQGPADYPCFNNAHNSQLPAVKEAAIRRTDQATNNHLMVFDADDQYVYNETTKPRFRSPTGITAQTSSGVVRPTSRSTPNRLIKQYPYQAELRAVPHRRSFVNDARFATTCRVTPGFHHRPACDENGNMDGNERDPSGRSEEGDTNVPTATPSPTRTPSPTFTPTNTPTATPTSTSYRPHGHGYLNGHADGVANRHRNRGASAEWPTGHQWQRIAR